MEDQTIEWRVEVFKGRAHSFRCSLDFRATREKSVMMLVQGSP